MRLARLSSSANFWPLDSEDAQTLKQVVIVHRHGTRFPTKPTGSGNISWPQRANFWENYKGHLTPVGSKQLQDIGEVLRARYIDHEHSLFNGCQSIDGRVVAVYTSNIQRTLQSAWSFLIGLLPEASIFFAFRSERVFTDGLRQAAGVPIYVEDATEGDDKLFHEWAMQPAYKEWLKENQKRSKFLSEAKDDPEYVALLDHLYAITREKKVKPNLSPMKRLVGAKDIDTLVSIDVAHKRPILPNEQGQPLLEHEVEMLRKIGDEVKRCWFGDAEGEFARSFGHRGAGYLAHKIWRHMDERARNRSHERFVEFSCHDTTMCALAAHFEIELEEIGFGAFFVLELHDDPTHGHIVKFYYNGRPAAGASSYESLRSVSLPMGRFDQIRPLGKCEAGEVPLSLVRRHCRIRDIEETFESFIKLLGRADLGPTRKDLEALLERNNWLSYEDWWASFEESYNEFDSDGDGYLNKTEFQAALSKWYGITANVVNEVFCLVDRDPSKDVLNEKDVYLAVCALVGVRGSMSDVTVQRSMKPSTDVLEDVNALSAGGTTKLMSAANVGDTHLIRELAAAGADVDIGDDFGWTALRYAVRKKNSETVKGLIELGADVNIASKSGRTPLMSAVANNAPDIVQLLVEGGADTGAKNRDGLAANDIASRGGGMGSSVVRQLLEA